MDLFSSLIGFCIGRISRLLHIGAGETWPGEIALRIRPSILTSLSKRVTKGIILVAGTNGKTTTSLMVKNILESDNQIVVHNASGANLLNGVVSSLVNSWGRKDWGIFEVDENALPQILTYVHPTIVVLLNLFRDQLDRYGEVDAIAERWKKALLKLDENSTVIANADDPLIVAICEPLKAKTVYIGLENESLYRKTMQHATDSIHCPKCGTRLTYGGVYYSHLGKWSCGACGFTHPDVIFSMREYRSLLEGVYNNYNAISAGAVGELAQINSACIQDALASFIPAFGRMEEMSVRGKNVRIVLSKNPTGFNESIQTYVSSKQNGPLLLLLNDRIPDGTDVSWIWDVDFELLDTGRKEIIISGDRAYDMAVRIKYALSTMESVTVSESLASALDIALSGCEKEETVWILATYSAMLEIRKIITGKKIL